MTDKAFEAERNFDVVHNIAKINTDPTIHNKDKCEACSFLNRYDTERIENAFSGKVYSVTENGWMRKIVSDLNEGDDCVVKLEGKDAVRIIELIDNSIHNNPVVSLFPDHFVEMKDRWKENFKKSLPFLVAPEMVILVFGSIGAFSGAFGCILWCIGLAHHNKTPISLRMSNSSVYIIFEETSK